MRNNETGEFELVVGNRQLLSGFFIVVLLFAVAFAMGYVVGQNSPRSAKPQPDMASSAPSSASDSRPQPASPAAAPPPAAPTGDAAAGAPAQTASETAPSTPSQPARESAPPDSTPAQPGALPALPEAPPGSYWQVMAVARADAEVVARTLKEKGFPATLSQGPNNLVRVLVGPYSDTQTMGKAKTDLENAGFRPIRK